MPQKKRLEDLFHIGKFLEFDDGSGEPLRVWLRKLNPVENATAARKANAARSRVRTAKKDPDSDIYQEVWMDVLELGSNREALLNYVAMERMAEIQLQAEARLAAEEEWSKDEYLQGLRDAWNDGLRDTYLKELDLPEEERDAEAQRVWTELERFDRAVRTATDEDTETARESFADVPLETLQQQALDMMLRFRGNAAWMDEFHYCELWMGTFEADQKTRYFVKREQVDGLSQEVLVRLLKEYEELSVDAFEGKDSEETHDSSPSSEQQDEAATGTSSGLAAVAP